MTSSEADDYIQRLADYTNRKLLALERAVEREFKCKAYWDPLEQAYKFTNGEGRKHKHWTKN